MNTVGLSGRRNGLNFKGFYSLGFQNVAVGRIKRGLLITICMGISPGQKISDVVVSSLIEHLGLE